MLLGRPDAGQQLTYVPYTNLVLSEEEDESEARVALTLMVRSTKELPNNILSILPSLLA